MDSARLFRSNCVALIVTAMSFATQGDIMGDFEMVFSLTTTEVRWIAGAAFRGFGVFDLIYLRDQAKGGYRVERLTPAN